MKVLSCFSVLSFLFLVSPLIAPEAQAAACSERDYRGLKVEALPPVMGEAVCQLKLLLKNRTNHDSLKLFVDVSESDLGFNSKDLQWDLPLVGVINGLINESLADGKLHKLAHAGQKHFVNGGRFNLEQSERELLDMLSRIELQHGGRR